MSGSYCLSKFDILSHIIELVFMTLKVLVFGCR